MLFLVFLASKLARKFTKKIVKSIRVYKYKYNACFLVVIAIKKNKLL